MDDISKEDLEQLRNKVEKLTKRVQFLEERQISRLKFLQLEGHKDEEFNRSAQKIIDQIEALRS
jgi:hypothetical protein